MSEIEHVSIEDIESMEAELMEKLDKMIQKDSETGEAYESEEYSALEDQLWYLQDVLHYIAQKSYFEAVANAQREIFRKNSLLESRSSDQGKNKSRQHRIFYIPFKCFSPALDDA